VLEYGAEVLVLNRLHARPVESVQMGVDLAQHRVHVLSPVRSLLRGFEAMCMTGTVVVSAVRL
jgi:hypothetical protein